MAKGRDRGNREPKKPKTAKKPELATSSFIKPSSSKTAPKPALGKPANS